MTCTKMLGLIPGLQQEFENPECNSDRDASNATVIEMTLKTHRKNSLWSTSGWTSLGPETRMGFGVWQTSEQSKTIGCQVLCEKNERVLESDDMQTFVWLSGALVNISADDGRSCFAAQPGSCMLTKYVTGSSLNGTGRWLLYALTVPVPFRALHRVLSTLSWIGLGTCSRN